VQQRGTYSIVAADPDSGEVGCAVQSKYFAVGWVVPWVRAGVGAVATQAAGVAAYGPQVLEELESGSDPNEAIRRVLADDSDRETRQLGAVTADGRSRSFTGSECNEWAGDAQGHAYAVQGNILAGEAVVHDMACTFEDTTGTLAERMMAALEAAEAAGGDRRGRQSAAMVVERTGAASETREGIDRVVDLRVDDHPEPIEELRRLLGIQASWRVLGESMPFYERKDYDGGIRLMLEGLAGVEAPAPLLLFNLACFESLAGRRDDAIEHLRAAIAADESAREMARADSDFEPLRDDPEFRALTGD
jgi:uncharacterized Ntn-hydrolase superfamily protein